MSGISGMWTNTSGQYFPRTKEDDLTGKQNPYDNPDKRYIDFPPSDEKPAAPMRTTAIDFNLKA